MIHWENLDVNHVFIGGENEENIIQTFLTNNTDKKDVDKIDMILNHPLYESACIMYPSWSIFIFSTFWIISVNI